MIINSFRTGPIYPSFDIYHISLAKGDEGRIVDKCCVRDTD